MKTPEQMAEEYANDRCGKWEECELDGEWEEAKRGFFAGYQAAKDEELAKDKSIADAWKQNVDKMLPSVHAVVLFPSQSTKASDPDVVAKMDAAIEKAKGNSSNNSNGWISVKERLPEEGEEVLVFGQYLNDIPKVLGVRSRYKGDQDWKYTWEGSDEWVYRENDVTHWMPLPKPPEKAHD